MNIQDFENLVENLASAKNPVIFDNSIPAQAAIVLMKIFKYTKNVLIYDMAMNGDITRADESFYPSLREFLQQGKSLKLVLRSDEEGDDETCDTIFQLSEEYKSQIEIRIASEEFKTSILDLYKNDINFAVGDNRCFRLENADNKWMAICSFNNEEYSSKLANAFLKYYKNCREYHFHINA